MRYLLPVALLALLAACMTTSPSSYQPLTRSAHFVLDEDTMIANKVSSGLAAGRYEAVFQDEHRTYFLGPPQALLMPNQTRVNGGIALPKSTSDRTCHLFIQVGDDSQAVRDMRMGLVVEQIAKLEAGRIREFKDDPACTPYLDRIHLIGD